MKASVKTAWGKLNAFAHTKWALLAVVALMLLLPLIVRNVYYVHIINLIGIYIMLTISLDLVLGTVGMTQLGHVGFYGVGAYAGAILSTTIMQGNGLGFWVSLPVSFLIAMLVGLGLGLLTLRLKGIFFALCTLGFGEVMRSLFLNLTDLTGGPYGIKAIPDPVLFGFTISSKQMFFYLIYLFVALTIWVVYALRASKYGKFWRSIREDEIVSSSLGINVLRSKTIALMISAGLAGMAGTIFAHYISYISPGNFVLDESILILSMAIVGGRDRIIGSILGAAVLTALPEVLRFMANYRMLIYGVGLVAMIIFRPEGVMGKHVRKQKK